MSKDSVIAERQGRIGRIRLNRPRALNALDLAMIQAIEAALDAFEGDPEIHAVVIDSTSDRAFCAGGDIRLIRDHAVERNTQPVHAFFSAEYALNLRIAEYSKPYIALIDGICMGGGIGVSAHGTYRVASERAVLAMPETAIGLFPDIGASFLLPRLPGYLGYYLGLTGARLHGADAVRAGLATHFVAAADFSALISMLAEDGIAALARVVKPLPPFSLGVHHAVIERAFSAGSIRKIIGRLATDGSDFALETLAVMRRASPSSLFWSLEIISQGAKRTLREALRAELALVMRVVEQADFHEGVRAMLIDKDRSPRWHPDRIEAVDPAAISTVFG
jgi:enoyl-CoA hydratase